MRLRLMHILVATSTATFLLEVYRIAYLSTAPVNCRGCSTKRYEWEDRSLASAKEVHHERLKNKTRTLTAADIFVGINTAPSFLDRAETIYRTWGRDLGSNLKFYSCPDFDGNHPYVVKDERIPCNDYPPVVSWLVTLKRMAEHREVSWFLKCDDDTYVNVPQFIRFVQSLQDKGLHPHSPYYFGSVGYGREQERQLLGLQNGSFFVMGGPCVGMSAGALARLAPIIDDCMHRFAVRMHSDTQLGRCFLELNITAGLPVESEKHLRALFRQFYSRVLASSHDGTVVAPFQSSTVPAILPPSREQQLTLHSIKDRLLMLKVHAQLRHHARPIPLGVNRTEFDRMKCTHNPMMVRSVTTCRGIGYSPYWTHPSQYNYRSYAVVDRCSIHVPECPVQLHAWRPKPRLIDAAYIICLHVDKCRAGSLLAQLEALHIPVHIVEAVNAHAPPAGVNLSSAILTLGEMAVRASFHKAFTAIRAAPAVRTAAVFEEDALLHHNFSARLADVHACPRCACHLARGSGCTPGMLLLGMTVWAPVTLREYDDESARTGTPCVNMLPNTYGAFAGVYNADLAPYALHWLESQSLFPVDWLHVFLSMEGFVCRGLRRPIAIANLSHNSTVKPRLYEGSSNATEIRYKVHDWNVTEFM